MSDIEQYKRQLVMMQEKMAMVPEAHAEEKKELNLTITELESKSNVGKLMDDKEDGDTTDTRLNRMENLLESLMNGKAQFPTMTGLTTEGRGDGSRHVSGESNDMSTDEHSNKEQTLSLTFGDVDTLPSSLERFISHYNLVNEINTTRGVKVWQKASYRALMLRMALRGVVADFIEQESRILSPWVRDDQQIIERLRARYIQNSAVELHIIAFEKSEQGENEPLSEYMVRLQKLVQNAFPEYPEWVNQNKVVWQFLNGARDKDVRETLIRDGWMIDNRTAKSYEVVLKTAEQVVNTKRAAKATGRAGQMTTPVVNQVSTGPPQKKRKSYGSVKGQNTSRSSGIGNFFCFCCRTTDHSGGWKECPKFKVEYPNWKPGDPKPIFQ